MKTNERTSVFSGPRGCQTRNVRDVPRNNEKFGKTVPTIGLINAGARSEALPDLSGDFPLIGLDFRHRGIADIVGTNADQRMAVAWRYHPLRAVRVRGHAAAERDLTADRWFHCT